LAQLLLPLENAHRDKRSPGVRRGEAGYALIELLVVASLLVIVLGAILTLGETSQRVAPKESERANVIREAQVGLHRMTRELRHAYEDVAVTPSTMAADVLGRDGVSYDCSQPHPTNANYTRCLRYVNGVGGEVVIDRVLNGDAVFTLTPPDYVHATVEVNAGGDLKNGYDHPILLEDGFYMRNLDG
jgi:type II secretory pathway pseudopilin PulG